MQALVSRGVTPETAKSFAPEIARATFQNMVFSQGTYSKGVNAAARSIVGVIEPERFKKLKESVGESFTIEALEMLDAQTCMMDAAKQAFGVSDENSPNWLIIWANGELEFYYDGDDFEDRFFGDTAYDEYVQGPVMLFSLGAMARMVNDRLPRPAIRLEGEIL
jgi:hypothetical protein